MNSTLNLLNNKIMDHISDYFNIDSVITEHINNIILKLNNQYKIIDSINSLQRGLHIRWIRQQPKSTNNKSNYIPVLTSGGILIDIQFTDNGIIILCKLLNNKFIKIKYDDCIIFQKMTESEWYEIIYSIIKS